MDRLSLMRFALRAARDWTFVPVLRDALLESPVTRDELETSIGFAERWAKDHRRHYVVIMYPRMLSPTWRKQKGFGLPMFAIYEYSKRRHGDVAGLIETLSEQYSEPVVPVHGAHAGRGEDRNGQGSPGTRP